MASYSRRWLQRRSVLRANIQTSKVDWFSCGRYYDPLTAHFISLDPLSSVTRQPYLYARGNPISFTDPRSLAAGAAGVDFGGGGAGIGGEFGGAVAINTGGAVAGGGAAFASPPIEYGGAAPMSTSGGGAGVGFGADGGAGYGGGAGAGFGGGAGAGYGGGAGAGFGGGAGAGYGGGASYAPPPIDYGGLLGINSGGAVAGPPPV